SRGWIVVDLGAKDTGVPLPPLDTLDQLLTDLTGKRTPGKQVLGTVYLGRFPNDAGSALGDKHIRCYAECRVRGDAAIAVRAATLRARDGGRRRQPRARALVPGR